MSSSRGLVGFLRALLVLLLVTQTLCADEGTPALEDSDDPALLDRCPPSNVPQESLLDNLSLLATLEASRQPQDLGINANFGGNLAANLGIPLLPELGIGGQVGTGVNLSRAGVKVLKVVEGTNERVQWWNTVGLFRRGDIGYAGVAYDLQYADYYDHILAGQVRAEVGWNATDDDTFGFWGTAAAHGDQVRVLATTYAARPISQIAAFWNRRWMTGAETRIWLGVAGQHGTDIVLLPDDHRTDPCLTFGLQVFVPLTERLALFGQGNFITPSDTGTLDAYLGFAYFFGGAAKSRTNRFAPVLPVANNPTFALDLRTP